MLPIIRRASTRIKPKHLSSAKTFHPYNAIIFSAPHPPLNIIPLLLRRFSSPYRGPRSSFIGNYSFSSQAGSESESEKEPIKEGGMPGSDSESESESVSEYENEMDSLDNEEMVAVNTGGKGGVSPDLFKVILDSSLKSTKVDIEKWVKQGNELSMYEILRAYFELRRRKMFGRALKLSEWLESHENYEFSEKDYASRVDFIAKLQGTEKGEAYIEKIPELFKGEVVYRTLLANFIPFNDAKNAERVFNKMKDLKLPISSFACNQLIILYKRTDRKKIADVLLLMEKEDIKPSLVTYRLLIETKGMSNDIIGMEQVLETMKSDGIEPDKRLQFILARQYIYVGMKEKAKKVINEMEEFNSNRYRKASPLLLQLYASLGSVDDVKRIWKACEHDTGLGEYMSAIEAFGKLKKVEEAEAVFNQMSDQMSKKRKKLSTKQYTCMLKVYASNKMLHKAKVIVKQMIESGCRPGPLTWDALVRLYIDAGEIEKTDSLLNKASKHNMKPLFGTYMMILDQYAQKGDVHNAEKIFDRMRQDGFPSRYRQYDALLQAYVVAKAPLYGFRERLKADNVSPSITMTERMAQVDAIKRNPMSELHD